MCTVAACGGGAAASSGPTTSSTAQSGSASGQNPPPGAFGTVAAVSGTSMEVQNQTVGQVTVNWTGTTKFSNEVSAALADVTTGECVSVTGPASTTQGTLTASNVIITQPATGGGCTFGNGRGGFGGGNGGNGSTRPSGAPRTRPSGAGNGNGANGSRAFGAVGAVNGNTFTVHSTRPNNSANNTPTDTTVTVTGTTTYTKTVSATSSAVAVGMCVVALGQTDDTGAVTANSITISKPGPNGCNLGFGGRGRGAGGARNGSGSGGNG